MTKDPHPWATTLSGLREQAWTRLSRGVVDRHAAARHPVLATVTPQGNPKARTVVLRAVDAAAGTLHIHTDRHSAKVSELSATAQAALHVWDAGAHLQIRLEADVTILTGQEALPAWQKVPDAARHAYGSTPPPGQPIPTALDYIKTPDATAFAVLCLTVQHMDLVHLGPDHRRAVFHRSDGWGGEWLAP